MMKKLSALLMALVMCVSLVACGGVDPQPAIDAFNSASDAYDNLVDKMNENIEAYPQDVIDVMNQMGEALLTHKETLESGEALTEEYVAELIQVCTEVEQWAKDAEAQLADLATTGVDKQPVIDAFNKTSTAFDKLANEVNANTGAYPQEFIDLLIQMSDSLTQCKELLESDQALTEEEANSLTTQLADIEAWVAQAEAEFVAGAEGGEAVNVDMQAAIDRFNMVGSMFDATANAVNANAGAFTQEFIDSMVQMSEIMSDYKALLESDYQPTEAEYTAMMADFDLIEQWLLEVEKQVFG